ncbi:MAG: mannose-6-phosphate isomerase, class I [Chitinophagaceae bacterium]
MNKIFPIKGVVQHYAWGGHHFLPELLHLENPSNEPWAEYWMGAHPKAPSIDVENGKSLKEIIDANPADTIGEKVNTQFGELPYLFKVLDVKEMLSIQVHPSKEEAEKGFDAEEKAGIPISASTRNYKDRNHKPEVMVALSEFWLLHGFLPEDKLAKVLEEVPEFRSLVSLFNGKDYRALYQYVMELPQAEVDNMLLPLIQHELDKKSRGELQKSDAGWWVCKLYENEVPTRNIDKGIYSIYFFNIVKANPGEAVFQAAGIPHAYLEGQNMELMANSDNVLRGGLTPKHVDVPELLKHTLFQAVHPRVMKAASSKETETIFECPVPDFGLSMIQLEDGQEWRSKTTSLEILFLVEGDVFVSGPANMLTLQKGQAVAILTDSEYMLKATERTTVFKAFVP